MKQIILLVILVCGFNAIVLGQVDSNKVIYDSIMFNKSKYIGQPLSTLFNDIKTSINFSNPFNMGSLKKGHANYQFFGIFLPLQVGKPQYDFWIELSSEVIINREEIIAWRLNGTFERKLKVLLKNQIVTDLKFY